MGDAEPTRSPAESETGMEKRAGPTESQARNDAPVSLAGSEGADEAPLYVLQLFVAGTTERSLRAVDNLRRLCEDQIPGRYELRVIDIYRLPEMAEIGQVIAAPTLVKELPLPLRRIVGDLADEDRVLLALGLRRDS